MKILITGGAGFIGSNFVRYMVKKYNDIKFYNIDKLTYAGNLQNLKDIENYENYVFIKEDICNFHFLSDLFSKEKFDYVIHLAAESHVDRSLKEPNLFIETNILGTQTLLEVSRLNKIKKFIHISTDEVYGDLDFDPTVFFTESTPLSPNSPYSASKASSDMIVRAYHNTYGLPINITRCSNNYGPYHFPEKLIPLTICKAINDEFIPIYGEGKNIRDWLHVIDHCRAIDLVVFKGKNGEIYNIGGHNEKSNLEVVKIILNLLNKSENLIKFVDDRLGHDTRYAIDPTKLENELDFKPIYKFESGIKDTVNWYLENQNWWKSILNGTYKNYYRNYTGNKY